jgi:hypothetical protein
VPEYLSDLLNITDAAMADKKNAKNSTRIFEGAAKLLRLF